MVALAPTNNTSACGRIASSCASWAVLRIGHNQLRLLRLHNQTKARCCGEVAPEQISLNRTKAHDGHAIGRGVCCHGHVSKEVRNRPGMCTQGWPESGCDFATFAAQVQTETLALRPQPKCEIFAPAPSVRGDSR